MNKNRAAVISAVLSFVLVAFFLLVNEIVISIRLNEVESYLHNIDIEEGGIEHISLIATYEVHKKLYEKRIAQDDADSIEYKMASLSLNIEREPVQSGALFRIAAYPAVSVINFNRKILGKPPVNVDAKGDYYNEHLDRAYYYERNYFFEQAIQEYDLALDSANLNRTLHAGILLRQGYCYALAGYNEKAVTNYQTIISDFSDENSAITATILLRYLEGFRIARERVLSGTDDPVFQSRQLVNLLAYEQALEIIETAEKTASVHDLAQLHYFKARCYSGLGQPEKAVLQYLEVITSAPDSPYAKYSNRKIYQIGTNMGGDAAILNTAKQINERLNDPVLKSMIENHRHFSLPPESLHEEIPVKIPEELYEKVEKIIETPPPVEDVFMTIITDDGHRFKGKLLKIQDDTVSIKTGIGVINIKKDRIKEITEN